jgi:hypothetical protein
LLVIYKNFQEKTKNFAKNKLFCENGDFYYYQNILERDLYNRSPDSYAGANTQVSINKYSKFSEEKQAATLRPRY